MGDERSHAILAAALSRGRPVSGHVYGREFVAAYAASGVTDTHEAIDRDIANDFIEAGIWVFLRGGNPATPWHSLVEAIKAVTELGASPQAGLRLHRRSRRRRPPHVRARLGDARGGHGAACRRERAWSMGSLHRATRFAMDGEIGGLGGGRRADLVLIDDELKSAITWYGGELVVEDRKITPVLEAALGNRYRYPEGHTGPFICRPSPQAHTGPARRSPRFVNAIGIALPGIVLPHRTSRHRAGQ